MKLHEVLGVADWPNRRFLTTTLALQMAAWSFAGITLMDSQLPIVQPVFSVLYYTFIPGFMILRTLRVHRLSTSSAIVYAVGLSLAFQMLVGVVANFALPYLAVPRPISTLPLTLTSGGAIAGLWVLCYFRGRNCQPVPSTAPNELRLNALLYIALPPILAVVGTYLENYFGTNAVLLVMLLLLASFPLVVGLSRFIPESLYPAAIFSVALALLYHSSLISTNLWGWDVFSEYYISSSVLNSGVWNPSLPFNVNAMLGTVILAPSYSIEAGLNLTWVFKLVYPFLFAFAPTALYMCFRRQLPARLAFASAFFLVALFVFYVEMIFLPRQQIAELFLALVMLLLVEKDIALTAKTILIAAFSIGIAVSHYGVTYLLLGSLLVAYLILQLTKHRVRREKSSILRPSFMILFATFAISWYIFISSSTNLSTLIRIGSYVQAHFLTDFLNPQTSQPLDIVLTGTPSPLHTAAEALHLLSQFLIGFGVLTYAVGRSRLRLNREFSALGGASFVVLAVSIAVPYFATALNTSRLYQYSLIFLAPFLPIGAASLAGLVSRVRRKATIRSHSRFRTTPLFVLVAVFLLFNAGVLYEIAQDHPTSISLDNRIDFPRYLDKEVVGAQWLVSHAGNAPIYADGYRFQLFLGFGLGTLPLPVRLSGLPAKSLVYLGNENIQRETVVVYQPVGPNSHATVAPLDPALETRSEVYNNGASQVWL